MREHVLGGLWAAALLAACTGGKPEKAWTVDLNVSSTAFVADDSCGQPRASVNNYFQAGDFHFEPSSQPPSFMADCAGAKYWSLSAVADVDGITSWASGAIHESSVVGTCGTGGCASTMTWQGYQELQFPLATLFYCPGTDTYGLDVPNGGGVVAARFHHEVSGQDCTPFEDANPETAVGPNFTVRNIGTGSKDAYMVGDAVEPFAGSPGAEGESHLGFALAPVCPRGKAPTMTARVQGGSAAVAKVGTSVSFVATTDCASPEVAWYFGDRAFGSGLSTTHVYGKAGDFQVLAVVQCGECGSVARLRVHTYADDGVDYPSRFQQCDNAASLCHASCGGDGKASRACDLGCDAAADSCRARARAGR